MEKKIRVAAVSYLNTKPLVYGFEKGGMKNEVELTFDYPAHVAAMLINDEVDVGLVPVAVIPKLGEFHIISNYCIGASGPVASVSLFSDVPVESVKEVLLDYQSRTSVALLKILLKDFWKINPEIKGTTEGYQDAIKGTTAGLVIGDRALKQRQKSGYSYDLAEAWQQMTGLPFLFAAWVANKQLPDSFIKKFNETTGVGLSHIDDIVAANNFPEYDLHTYYTTNIDYKLDEKKKDALGLFLQKINS